MMINKRIISLGLGQQSTALYFKSCFGELPRADYAIFADPGAESSATYKYLKWLQQWQKENNGIPIIIARGKTSIYSDLIKGRKNKGEAFSSIPAYTKNPDRTVGMLRRQCTYDYKIDRVNKAIREIYGLKRYARTPNTEIWLGITVEELSRVRYADYAWQTHVYPFCNYRTTKKAGHKLDYFLTTRSDCVNWLKAKSLPIPPKSSCFFCPYQGNASWLKVKTTQPKEWRKAVKLDKELRNSTAKGVEQPIYLHRQCVPLDQVNLNEDQLTMFDQECEGVCDV